MVQTKEDKEKQIANAIRILKEMLDKTYLDSDNEFYGININNLTAFQNGNFTRRKDGSLYLQISMPEWFLKKEVKGLPRKFSEWAFFPVVIGLSSEPEEMSLETIKPTERKEK